MNDFAQILKYAVEKEASDIFIVAGLPVSYKINGRIEQYDDEMLLPQDTEELLKKAYVLAGRQMSQLAVSGDDDFSISITGLSRFRISSYKQRGSLAAVIRVVAFDIPDKKVLNVPDAVMNIAKMSKGLVLVTGPAGGGKSTTLACIIDEINKTRNCHIITLEDPIEYLHRNKKSVISQREVHSDTQGYVPALRACLRQAPDVILVGEMRDFETIKTAMTAAETGHLVISTLHSVGATNTIDRIIDVFPPNQQQQIRVQLSQLLQMVVSQQLIPTKDGGLVPAFEIMYCTGAVRNMIRESKVHQIDTVIAASSAEGMVTMDNSLISLYKQGKISKGDAMRFSENTAAIEKKLI